MRQVTLALFMVLLTHASIAGTVQCECPSVDAKATGDSSCSATETGGECTIDFNTFDPGDEEKAFTLLKGESPIRDVEWTLFDRYPGLTPELATRLNNRQLVDLLMVYVLVSGVQGRSGLDGVPIGAIHSALNKEAGDVVGAFGGDSIANVRDLNMEILVSNGCVEVKAPGVRYWAMFKAYWSNAAAEPRCAGSGDR